MRRKIRPKSAGRIKRKRVREQFSSFSPERGTAMRNATTRQEGEDREAIATCNNAAGCNEKEKSGDQQYWQVDFTVS